MKKIFITLSLVLFSAFISNAAILTKSFDYKDFTGISVSGAIDVELVQSDTFSVSVRADEKMMEYIEVSCKNGILKISMRNISSFMNNLFSDKDVDFTVSMPLLNSVVVSGAGDVDSEDTFTTTGMSRFSISASGASDVSLSIAAPEVVVTASGASDVELEGDAGELDVKLSGASDFDGSDFAADNVSVNASGASKAEVYVNKRLSVDVSGASSCIYSGNNQIQLDAMKVTGASTLKRR